MGDNELEVGRVGLKIEVLIVEYIVADGSTVMAIPSRTQNPCLLSQHSVFSQPQQMLLSEHCVTLTSVSLYGILSSA